MYANRKPPVLTDEDYCMSLSEVAKELGLTVSRVSQIEHNALRKLNKILAQQGRDKDLLDILRS